MEKNVCVYSHGCLLHIPFDENRLRLNVLKFRNQGFERETDYEADHSQATGTHNIRQEFLGVHAAEECVDQATGDRFLYLLVCRSGKQEKRHTLFRVNLHDGDEVKVHADSATSTPTTLEFAGSLDFCCENPGLDRQLTNVVVTHGPHVLHVATTFMTLFHRKNANGTNFMQSRFPRCKADQNKTTRGIEDGNAIVTILASQSEKNWIVVITRQQVSTNNNKTSVSQTYKSAVSLEVFALEKHKESESETYRKTLLDSKEFIPQDYASKISCVTLCVSRKYSENMFGNTFDSVEKLGHFNNSCIVGLNDGYVLVVMNGCIMVCVTLEQEMDIFLPSVSVKCALFVEQADVLVCHTSSKDCFVVNPHTSKIVQQWQRVEKTVVSDFLMRGDQQLLLLFEGWIVDEPNTNYLLTDLQGLTIDKRSDVPFTRKLTDSYEQGNLQRAFDALQTQNQGMVRSVADKEKQLKTKLTFVVESWLRLHNLNLGQQTWLQHPEVPLTPLLHGPQADDQIQSATCNTDITGDNASLVSVISMWHRILENSCVIGVKIVNTSHRDLTDMNLVISPASVELPCPYASGCSASPPLSTTSETWRCCQLRSSAAGVGDGRGFTHVKRRKTDGLLSVQPVRIVHPTDTVTVTCILPTRFCTSSSFEWLVHLHFVYHSTDGCNSLPSTSRGFTSKGAEVTGCSSKAEQCQRPVSVHDQQFVFCGKMVPDVSEVLKEEQSGFWAKLMNVEEEGAVLQSEAAVLAISATQRGWCLRVAFVLHEATILRDCIHRAGLAYLPLIGQYVFMQGYPACLRLVRIALEEETALLPRETRLRIFTRDWEQLLLLLRHLYSHLPDDATITLVNCQQDDSKLRSLTAAMSAELGRLRRECRTVLHGLTDTNMAQGKCSETRSPRDDFLASESQDFASHQRRYRLRQTNSVSVEDREVLLTRVRQSMAETDVAVAML